jgi:DNA-binding MarR family transcriptional regulator
MNDITPIRQAVRTTAFDEALAAHLGLNPTDLRCLELAIAEPGVTPGRLAEMSGLTTGAVTGVLDRLEKAGLVERRPGSADRRSVAVHPVGGATARVLEVTSALDAAIGRALDAYPAAQRRAIGGFLDTARGLVLEETSRLVAGARGGFVGDRFTAPLGGVTRGRLVFVSGAPRLALNLAPLGPQASARMIMETSASRLEFSGTTGQELISASFDGPLPDLRTSAGTVAIRYRRQALTAFASRTARVSLNGSIPWAIEIEGGITDLTGTLEAVTLERMEVKGGANHIRLDLPVPAGSVPIRVTGVASSARFRRPAAVPVAVNVAGGISHLRLDGRRHEQVSGRRRFVGDGFADRPDRYEIELLDGASEVVIAPR